MQGLSSLRGRLPLLGHHGDEGHKVTDQQAGFLAEMITQPTGHCQRFVEQLTFAPRGGQCWERTLQIELPAADGREERWWIVPLGPYNRRRFPDVAVTDANGESLNLLSRETHSLALTKAIMVKQLYVLAPPVREFLKSDPAVRTLLDAFYSQLGDYLTEIIHQDIDVVGLRMEEGERPPSDPDAVRDDSKDHPRVRSAHAVMRSYAHLLAKAGASDLEVRASLASISRPLGDALLTTHYLCWLRGRPNEIITLRESHSTADPKRVLSPLTIRGFLKAIVTSFLGRWGSREAAADWYRRFGLAPFKYAFNVPTHRYTRSYYSTITSPENTELLYLDWEVGNSERFSEVDCSQPSVHLYNDAERLLEEKDRRIRAYIRCEPRLHKQILGAAALNLIIVILLAEGTMSARASDGLQALLIAAPSVVIAFLVQQQRHYYAHALRPLRAILWTYLVVGGAFLITIAFSSQHGVLRGHGLTGPEKLASWALAVSSVAIFAWHFLLGPRYKRLVTWLYDRKCELLPSPEREQDLGRLRAWVLQVRRGWKWNRNLRAEWDCYDAAYEQFGRCVWRAVVILSVGAAVYLWFRWGLPCGDSPEVDVKSLLVDYGW